MKGAILTSILVLMQSIIKRLEEYDAFSKDQILDGLLRPHISVVLTTTTPYEQENLSLELSSALERLWREDLIRVTGYDMVENERLLIEHGAKQ